MSRTNGIGPGGSSLRGSMIAIVCEQPQLVEAFYRRNFGFRRARIYYPGEANEVVVLKAGTTYIQLFPALQPRPKELDVPVHPDPDYPGGSGAGPLYPGLRKLAFYVPDVDKKIEEMGTDAKITRSARPGLIKGSKIVWIMDPAGVIIELIEGYRDEKHPPVAPRHPIPRVVPWRKEPSVQIAVSAARRGDTNGLKIWLDLGGDPNQYDGDGWTPLLAAAVRGQRAVVELLLQNSSASPDVPHAISGALPIHFAGHSGCADVALALLKSRPEHLEKIWEINGHTLLLQAVFYGHQNLTSFCLQRGANTAATTLRGLGAMELALQFQNSALVTLIEPYDSPRRSKEAYFRKLLQLVEPTPLSDEMPVQRLSDELCVTIEKALKSTAGSSSSSEKSMARIRDLIRSRMAPVNRLGGILRQPPLVVAVTGNDGDPIDASVTELRQRIAGVLLEHGADPTIRELHPMGVHAIIRAAVFNHLHILKIMAASLPADRLQQAINEQPVVNGLTALHDTVLRAGTASPEKLRGYLEQIRWLIGNGARTDMEDYSGRTQRDLAEQIKDPGVREQVLECLANLPARPATALNAATAG